MRKSKCQCTECACSPVSDRPTNASRPVVDHNHKMLPGILRYRGLETEAEFASRLLEMESLIVTLQSVHNDLDASMAALLSGNSGPEQDAEDRKPHPSGCCASGTA